MVTIREALTTAPRRGVPSPPRSPRGSRTGTMPADPRMLFHDEGEGVGDSGGGGARGPPFRRSARRAAALARKMQGFGRPEGGPLRSNGGLGGPGPEGGPEDLPEDRRPAGDRL